MDLHLQLDGRADLARQVYRQIRAAVLDGRLARGDRLPPSRELAQRLDVSRNTVSAAYAWLTADGLLSGRRGAGSYVTADPVSRPPRKGGARLPIRAVWKDLAAATPVRAPEPGFASSPVLTRPGPPLRFDFGVGTPDPALFPFDTWRRLLARQVRASRLDGAYGDPAGVPALRAAIARHVAVSRGVLARPEDVVVTRGAQGAFDLVARVLVEPGARVAVEEPGYPSARLLFASHGARVAAVPVDGEGLVVDTLPPDARLVHVTPSHQLPLGVTMSHARRVALLEWAERRNAVVLEDDYDGEFRFEGRPLPTLQAIDRTGRVVYVGSFSKTLLPTLRLGFLVAPASLATFLRAASWVAGWPAPGPEQAALAGLLEGGLFARHVRKARRAYAGRHRRILATLERDLAAWLEPIPSGTGLHLAAWLRTGGVRREREIAAVARDAGIGFDRLSAYYAGEARAGVVLGYGAIPEARLAEGLRRLRGCFGRR